MSAIRGQPIGIFHCWWRGDRLPDLGLSEVAGLAITPAAPAEPARLPAPPDPPGDRLWVARVAGEVVAHGWASRRRLSIGELGIARELPAGNRYLWGFATLPAWRGRGLYPRLLQAIVRADPDGERFWIGHDIGNEPSRRGIARAGFTPVGTVYAVGERLVMVPDGADERVRACAAVFEVPLRR